MKSRPILQQCGERQSLAGGRLARLGASFLALGGHVQALRHIAHNSARGVARLGQRDGAASAERDPALLAAECILGQIGLAAGRRHAHGEATLLIVKYKDIPFVARALEGVDSRQC